MNEKRSSGYIERLRILSLLLVTVFVFSMVAAAGCVTAELDGADGLDPVQPLPPRPPLPPPLPRVYGGETHVLTEFTEYATTDDIVIWTWGYTNWDMSETGGYDFANVDWKITTDPAGETIVDSGIESAYAPIHRADQFSTYDRFTGQYFSVSAPNTENTYYVWAKYTYYVLSDDDFRVPIRVAAFTEGSTTFSVSGSPNPVRQLGVLLEVYEYNDWLDGEPNTLRTDFASDELMTIIARNPYSVPITRVTGWGYSIFDGSGARVWGRPHTQALTFFPPNSIKNGGWWNQADGRQYIDYDWGPRVPLGTYTAVSNYFPVDTYAINLVNTAPVADAGLDQEVDEGTMVFFDGSNSYDHDDDIGVDDFSIRETGFWDGNLDPEGDDGITEGNNHIDAIETDHLTYYWNFGSGWELGGPTAARYYDDDGTYSVGLFIIDADGSVDVDWTEVRVDNVAPIVDAGTNQNADEGETVFFSGSFTDPGADTHTIEWNFGDGETDSGTLTPTHEYGDDGVYTVTLTVTDDDSGVGQDTLTVSVGNMLPTVNAGPDKSVNEGATLNIVPTFSDPGWLDTHESSIDWDDGTVEAWPATEENSPPDATGSVDATHEYGDDGTYTIWVSIKDDENGWGSDSLTATVSNVKPTIDAGVDIAVDEGIEIDITSTFTDPGWEDTHTALINWGDGSPVEAGTVTEENVKPDATGTVTGTHYYKDEGTYTVTVTVTDDDGASDSDQLTVTVYNVPPKGDAGQTWSFEQGYLAEDDDWNRDHDYWRTTNDGSIGSKCIGFAKALNPNDYPAALPTQTLVSEFYSRVFNVAAGTQRLIVEFDYMLDLDSTGNDEVEFYVVKDGGSTIYSDTLTEVGWTWAQHGTIDLSGHLPATTIQLYFRFTADDIDGDGQGFRVDGITLTGQNVITGTITETYLFSTVPYDQGENDVLKYDWDFGDGQRSTLQNPSHLYGSPGTYTVTLTIDDQDGGTRIDTITVNVGGAKSATQKVDSFISGLSDEFFVNNPEQRKETLSTKLNEVGDMIETGNYQGAANKLENDVRAKMDGSIDGNPNNDWITDPLAQFELTTTIDGILEYLTS